MKKFNSIEEAYQELAKGCIDFVYGRSWDFSICQCEIFNKMASVTTSLTFNSEIQTSSIDWPDRSIDKGGAALFIRDDLQRATGQRIWGLTFTLFPDGKFKIEYDYNKPDGYEETDEVITGDEINASLSNLNEKNKNS
ncbi:hypothetical protein [Comamonas sp. wu1-DMT]|uniref:hypothetical protein n=1 Tax=Comamonas sp. wu1-DMT TaxID=3126390 RepID=UPI0032E45147